MNHTKQNLRPNAPSLSGRIDGPGSLRAAASALLFLLLFFGAWNLVAAAPTPGDLDLSFNPGSMNGPVYAQIFQPDGKILIAGGFSTFVSAERIGVARLNLDGKTDTTFLNGLTAANSTVYSLAIQADGKVLIGGYFTSVNGMSRNRIARLNKDGNLDTSFLNGLAGADSEVRCLALQADGKVLIGGRFWSVNGVSRKQIARLNTDGTLDIGFNYDPLRADATIYALAVQPDGKVLIGGSWNSSIIRLNSDGSPDLNFQGSYLSVAGDVRSMLLQADGKVLIGGDFDRVGDVRRNCIARLNDDGSVDTGFLNGLIGANYTVGSLAMQKDGKVLIGGRFTSMNGVSRGGIARLNSDRSLDTGFLNGLAGTDGMVFCLTMQQDWKILVGGDFQSVNGEPRAYLARLSSPPPSGPPAITASPQSRTNNAGTAATFSVLAVGAFPLSYQWRFNGIAITGATNASLSLSNVGNNDAGSYDVVVTNLLGSVTSVPLALLTIIVIPPIITSQPASQTVYEGKAASFQVTSAGSMPLSYQWHKDGINMSNTARVTGAASNSLAIFNAQAADDGAYEVVVSNAAGSVTSAPPAILTVTSAVTPAVVWNQNQVLGPNVPGYPFAGVYPFTNLTIGDDVQVTSSNISHLVIQVSGTLTLGSNVVIRVRNGYYTNAPQAPLLTFTTNNLSTAGVDAAGVRLYPDAFGKGGNGGSGEDGGGYAMMSGINILGGGGGGGGGGFGGGQPGEGGPGLASAGQPGSGNGLAGGGGAGSENTHYPDHVFAGGGAGGQGGAACDVGEAGSQGSLAQQWDYINNGPDMGWVTFEGGGGGGGGNGGNGGDILGSGTLGVRGGGGGGYGGGVLTIIADSIVYDSTKPPFFCVAGQKGGSGYTNWQFDCNCWVNVHGQDGEGGMLIIQAREYAASSNHWSLGTSTYGSHAAGATNGGHGIVTGDPQRVFLLSMPSAERPLIIPSSVARTNGHLQFTLQGESGRVLEVQASEDVGLTNWTILATLTNLTGTMAFTDPATNLPQRFYRARQLP